MQELRLVLIIVGALAIAALLFHGLWTSKKEGKSKFAEKSPEANDGAENAFTTPSDDLDVVKKERSGPGFGVERNFATDPLGVDDPIETEESFSPPSDSEPSISGASVVDDEDDIPSIRLSDDIDEPLREEIIFSDGEDEIIIKPKKVTKPEPEPVAEAMEGQGGDEPQDEPPLAQEPEPEVAEPELQVIVIHVHCAGETPFVGTKLFDSMQQNGLIYGEMDIFHRHNDLSGNGQVLFSVANMMQPGTLRHDDPETFTTKGISFFMTLPCFGDPDQNFKMMLRTAQQIADDMGANVLDDERNLMTPDRLSRYRIQIRDFKAAQNAQTED